MLTDAQVIAEWKLRRSVTWQAIRLSLAICVACGVAFWYLARTPASEMSGRQLLTTFVTFCVLGVAMLVVIIRTNKLYRCPRCNSVPKGAWSTSGPATYGLHSGVALNPKRCGTCGVVLQGPVDA